MREYLITCLGGDIHERLQKMSKPTNREQALAQARLLLRAGAQRVKVEELSRVTILDAGPEPCEDCDGKGTGRMPGGGGIQTPCWTCKGSGRKEAEE